MCSLVQLHKFIETARNKDKPNFGSGKLSDPWSHTLKGHLWTCDLSRINTLRYIICTPRLINNEEITNILMDIFDIYKR